MESAWEAGYAALCAHVATTGSAAARQDLVVNGYPLGAWVGQQRARRKQSTLTTERVRSLQSVTGWPWNAASNQRRYTWVRTSTLYRS